MALKCESDPSGLAASEWIKLCSSFGPSSTDLCCATYSHHLCVEFVDPCCLSAFVACCLLALDKCIAVYPVGIDEIIQRIVSKAILSLIYYRQLDQVSCVWGKIQGVKLLYILFANLMVNLILKQFCLSMLLVHLIFLLGILLLYMNIQELCHLFSVP